MSVSLDELVLGASALVFLGVAVTGLAVPRRIVEPLGGSLSTPSMASEIRGNYGGMHLGMAVLLALSLLHPELTLAALALVVAFTGGLCLGRVVSWIVDGRPNRYLRFFFGLEAAGAIAAATLLVHHLR